MIAAIQDFFKQFIEPGTDAAGAHDADALRLATAAILVEMMRIDRAIDAAERAAVTDALRRQFNLDSAQLDTLIALADQQSRQATDYHQFTSLINKSCDYAQKVQIVQYLWQIALADGVLDAHELHLMRKLANLLYVRHGDYIAAKLRAREVVGVPPE